MNTIKTAYPYSLRALACAVFFGSVLSACGGGGGSGGSAATPSPTPNPGNCVVRIVADASVAAGKTAGATVQACSGLLADVSWVQDSGATVELQAARSATVAFEPAVAGSVRLRANVVLADGATASATADIAVSAAPTGSFVTVRADHSVRANTTTSLRAWPSLAGSDTVAAITWTQTAGPSVTMDTSTPRLLIFTSPQVTADTVLKFRAVMTTSSGQQDADDVSVGVEVQAARPNGYLFDATERVHPYRTASTYAGVLSRCTYDIGVYYVNSSNTNFCSTATLPLLQTEAGAGAIPSVAQVMGRVLVSHDFLGANFENFLTTQDVNGDFRRLLAGVTAIVIGSHVRPSYYTEATGAIYLDANNLWLTPAQRDVVTEVPDYRIAFANGLNFSNLGRQIRNNEYARASYPTTSRSSRATADLISDLGSLLYHELAHASDYFSPADRAVNPALSVYANVAPREAALSLPSDALAFQYPLQSSEMKALAQVLYQGATATAQQKAYSATDIGRLFAADRASDDYAYSVSGSGNSREDLAMLFEEFMMSYRHGIVFDYAYTDLILDGQTAQQVLVRWGERGRIGEASIKPRLKLVLARVAPWIDLSAVDRLPAPILMTPGVSWEGNRVISPVFGVSASSLRAGTPASAPRSVSEDLQGRRRH
ncbi:hypothetical protein [Massilia sp. PWRC2]|uniref:hypothetical protein n=1 Tax=Massilia sp. PWRC2 TaxID=2804626 RepID=UPI003CF7F366